MTRTGLIRVGVAFYVAWGLYTAVIVGTFAREVLPTPYLARPVLVAGVLAIALALVAVRAGRHAPLVAVTVAGLMIDPAVTGLLALVACAGVAILRLRKRPMDLTGLVVVLTSAYLTVGVVRALPLMEPPIELPAVASEGRRVFVLLLDGYPRVDSLDALGINNQPFVSQMERRGFDHYPDATSRTSWTELTLTSMFADPDIPNIVTTNEEKRRLRARWRLPPGFLAVDPPLGFATIPGVPHVAPAGITDFEAHLVGQSLVGRLVAQPVRSALGASVLAQHEYALNAVATTGAHRVFAHIAAPHPPFVFGGDEGKGCWPACHLWKTTHESLAISQSVWAEGMAGQLTGLNAELLNTVDRLIEADPDAVIVLFSDHGGRYSLDAANEWHKTFLMARTPGHPELFTDRAHPPDVFLLLADAYELR